MLSDSDLELASKYIFAESDFKDWLSGKKENVHVMMFTHEALEAFLAERDAQQADKVRELEAKYNELIMAVARKFPNETRHQTALRYINEAELAEQDYIPVGALKGE